VEFWSGNGNDIYNTNSGNVGIGTTSPVWELEVANPTAGDGVEVGVTANDASGAVAAYSSTLGAPFEHYAGRVSLFAGLETPGLDLRADGSTGDMRFYTGGPWPANERMRITASGNVGIGTTTPTNMLELSSASPKLYFNRESSSSNLSGLYWRSSADDFEGAFVRNNSTGDIELYTDVTGGTPRMVITNSGNVGIGTTSPTSELHVEGTIEVDWTIKADDASGLRLATDEGTTRLIIRDSGEVGIGTSVPDAKLEVRNSSNLVSAEIINSGNSGFSYGVNALATGAGGTIHYAGRFQASGATTNYAIYADGEGSKSYFQGNVGIGTTSPGIYMLAVNGLAAKTGGGSWSVFSDIRLKEVSGTYKHGLEEICKLNPVRYKYKNDQGLGLPTDREFTGLVAQEIHSVIPEAVEENDDGYLMVNNDPVIWAMVNAIKELKVENESLKQKLEALERAVQQPQTVIMKGAVQ
jgi:hypothetical protein